MQMIERNFWLTVLCTERSYKSIAVNKFWRREHLLVLSLYLSHSLALNQLIEWLWFIPNFCSPYQMVGGERWNCSNNDLNSDCKTIAKRTKKRWTYCSQLSLWSVLSAQILKYGISSYFTIDTFQCIDTLKWNNVFCARFTDFTWIQPIESVSRSMKIGRMPYKIAHVLIFRFSISLT